MSQILVAVDFSKSTDVIIDQAGKLAKALHAKLWILHVTSDDLQTMVYEAIPLTEFSPEFISVPSNVQLARDLSAEEIKHEHARLHQISSGLRGTEIDAQAILLKGKAAELILEKAAELEVDMIILGSHGHGLLHKALLGSVSEAVLRHATCNVLVVPSSEKQ